MAEEAERSSAIRAELQRLGVAKVDLAFKAVQDGMSADEDGRLVARADSGEIGDEGLSDAASSTKIRNFCRRGLRADRARVRTQKAPATARERSIWTRSGRE